MKRARLLSALGLLAVLATATIVAWPDAGDDRRPGSGAAADSGTGEPLVDAEDRKFPAGVEATARPGLGTQPADQRVVCPPAGVTVSTAAELTAALAGAAPGDVIGVRDGLYTGNFTATTVATADRPIFLCGSRQAVLDGGGPKEGYVLHLDGAQYWRIVGLTVSNGQKGVMGDGVVGSVIQDLHVTGTGDEAVHLRRFSTDNLVIGNEIDTTGLRRDTFGEGVYIGTAVSNWCTITDCEPDRSDRNVVSENRISNTGSESIDLKEGTTGGAVRRNTFDGTGMTGADSWVDVKGNAWIIEDNSGVNSPLDGFQTHHILDSWGDWNLFRGNSAAVNAAGFGFALRPAANNVLACDNETTEAASGASTAACRTP